MSDKTDKTHRGDPPTPTSTLSGKTNVKLELVIAVVPVLVAFAMLWFKMDAVQSELKRQNDRAWTISKQSLWAERLRADNPPVKVPSVSEVANAIGKE